ncbi:MAG: efflux transporter outer membrane subunit [Solimonas sp.]
MPCAVAAAIFLSGCVSLAPTYQRPPSPVAAQWRDGAAGGSGDRAVADIGWQELFRDARLRQVITLSLDHNRDLRLALLDIERASAEYRIERADGFPAIDADVGASASHTPAALTSSGRVKVSHAYTATVGFSSYELDLFGRFRSLRDAALETFFAAAETQRSTRLSLVAEVAGNWLTLAADRRRLALAQQTLTSQRETLRLTESQYAQGLVSALNLAQVQISVESARAEAARYTAQIEQDQNALELVVGTSVPVLLLPATIEPEPVVLASPPAGLDSSVLLQRPDVMAAEHALRAANADIGAARAAFFPALSLTASAGRGSDALSNLLGGESRSWSFAPSISVPIFNAGALRAGLKKSQVERDAAVVRYEKTIQTAFSEVADALAVRETLQEQLAAQQALVAAASRAYTLADARYRSGVDSYLDALDAQRSLYAAQQNLITLELTEQRSRVTLYKVLGGGAGAQSPLPAVPNR